MNMKKLSALLALLLGLLTGPALAQPGPAVQGVTNNGNFINQGALTASNLNPVFTSVGGSCGNSGDYFCFTSPEINNPFAFNINTNTFLLGTQTNTSNGSPIVNNNAAEIVVFGLRVICLPYNANFLTLTSYPYTAETNGIAGGVVTIAEYPPTGPSTVVGTVIVPNSPHGGPYLNRFVTTLPTSYVPTYGSVFSAWVSSYNAGPSQAYQECTVSLDLQSAPQV